jgi:hypothetical protein
MRYRFYTIAALALASSVAIAPHVQAQATSINGVPVEATIMRAGSTAQKVARIKSVPAVGIIKIRRDFDGTFRRGIDRQDAIAAAKISAERNSSGVNKLRKALRNNPATRNALASYGISINRIVGVDVGSNGALRVYVL